tara:strand:+ start:7989 stop:8306 length:318 start_codon:yes stop_codon:yes gene_type:complete
MKWLLIASAMNLQLTYGDEASCRSAQTELKQEIPSAICIPAGEEHNISQVDHILDKVEKFLDIVIEKQDKANNTQKSDPMPQSIDMIMEKGKQCMRSYGRTNCEL